ncbi:PIN domain-containing protein [Methylobacterium sp. E-005]|uniref:PIN domain-containing protein n=1 Tax=Methylobacterium sp. E-005 TaxID=2836549 RepID=UPI001FB8CB72|nr:PIN domain-containing protein [Methylobacterium sp. E-005]MCJ2089421.1 PIN domain-containing protein [Methylobacterium sp. E-005]
MTERIFVDTNVLIYGRDTKQGDKRIKAQARVRSLGARGAARINMQVLNELTRWILKNEPGRSLADIRQEIEALKAWGDKPLDEEELEVAWAVRDKLGYQWFDCLLLASARLAGCRYFLTEDMAHGAVFDGLTLINPFRTSPDDVLRRT